ncbi:Splicing factor, partial [Nowakowskiella sp. JEL0078]
ANNLLDSEDLEDIDPTSIDNSPSVTLEIVRLTYAKGLPIAGQHFKSSQELWKAIIAFEIKLLEKERSDEQVERVRKLFLDRLSIAHEQIDESFSEYSSFETNFGNQYEKRLLEANKSVQKVKEIVNERDPWERSLV